MTKIYKNKDFEDKLKRIIKDGEEHLHLIIDFDKTITKECTSKGVRNTSFGIIQKSKLMPQGYVKETNEFYKYYHDLEMSRTISQKEKTKYMIEWWVRVYEIMKKYNLNLNQIKEIVKENPFIFRKGTKNLFDLCEKANIPILIFSAGITQVIELGLKHENLNQKNVHVVSNKFEFNEDGSINNFGPIVVQSQNKDERIVRGTPYEKILKKKRNVIVIGDLPADVTMTRGMDHDNELYIGLLNEFSEEKLKQYLDNFDAVITHDGPFDFVIDLIKSISKQ
jgi:cytosolic 5'-nucleotidase 3